MRVGRCALIPVWERSCCGGVEGKLWAVMPVEAAAALPKGAEEAGLRLCPCPSPVPLSLPSSLSYSYILLQIIQILFTPKPCFLFKVFPGLPR